MKRISVLLIASVFSISVVWAADVKIDATMSFAADAPKIYVSFETKGLKKGDKVRGALIAEDVGEAAPANTKVVETPLDLDEDTDDGGFEFSKPTNDWPAGKYRVEIYVNDKLATTVKFTIKASD